MFNDSRNFIQGGSDFHAMLPEGHDQLAGISNMKKVFSLLEIA